MGWPSLKAYSIDVKICVIGATYPFRGGAAHYNTILCSHLAKRHDTTVISFKRQYPQFLYPGQTDIDPSNAPIEPLNSSRILDGVNPLSWLKCGFNICRIKPQVLLFHWTVSYWTPLYFTLCTIVRLFCKVRILIICHNVIEHEANVFSKLCSKLVLSYGDYFVVHSDEDCKNLLDFLPEANVKKVHHPTYETFNRKSPPNSELLALRKHLGLGKRVILFFGFVREYKGLSYLLKALPAVLTEVNIKLLIVGEFWGGRESYDTLIDELDISENVCIVDRYVPNEDVGKYFSVADVTIIPYISATGSGIVQLSFGFERPVIATKVGCLPEVVVEGETGFLVEPEKEHDLAEAIIRFYREADERQFAENIRAAKKNFSWDSLIEVIEQVAVDDTI